MYKNVHTQIIYIYRKSLRERETETERERERRERAEFSAKVCREQQRSKLCECHQRRSRQLPRASRVTCSW